MNETVNPTAADRSGPARLHRETEAMVREEAPLRFAVCAVNEAENDAAILVWGQEFPDGRVEVVPDLSRVRGSFRSVDSLLRRMRACGDHPLRLVRLDPERPPTTPGPL